MPRSCCVLIDALESMSPPPTHTSSKLQSNMEVRVADAFNATAEIAAAGDYPGIRMWTAANVIAESRTDDIVDIQKGQPDADIGPYASSSWATSTPAAFPKKSQSLVFGTQDYFSAACFFFGRDVYISQGGAVPIGLMASDWGGQPIEPFMSPDALADKTCGGTRNTTAEADVAPPIADQQPEGLGATSAASVLWWGMVEPLAQMRMTGAVWYQGYGEFDGHAAFLAAFLAACPRHGLIDVVPLARILQITSAGKRTTTTRSSIAAASLR